MQRIFEERVAWTIAAVLVAASFAAGWAVSLAAALPEEGEFNVMSWELRHLPDKWLYLAGSFFTGGLSEQEQDEVLGRYLVLNARIGALASSAEAEERADEIERLIGERDGLEQEVEATIEGRLTALLEDERLTSSLPFFPDARWVWPPVDFELNEPPRVLNLSPRERIELVSQEVLNAGMTLDEIEHAEAEAEAGGGLSAHAASTSGMALYPSIVAHRADYESLAATVAHEWAHHHLSFKPLGLAYTDSLEMQTLNETIADLVGRELGARLVERYPLPATAQAELDALLPQNSEEELNIFLRDLRLDVEALLDAGEVEAAEALMEQRRLELAATGTSIRRINQAFFAYQDVYALDPVSIDPLGQQVVALRFRAADLDSFLEQVSGFDDAADVEDALGG
jgi:hypothetical protein